MRLMFNRNLRIRNPDDHLTGKRMIKGLSCASGTMRYQRIEQEILTLVLGFSDHSGYSTNLPSLALVLGPRVPDTEHRELVDALKRLSPQYLTLQKWSEAHRKFLQYPGDVGDDSEFFYRGGFRLQRTPQTDPYLQKLALELDPRELRSSMTSIALISEVRLAELRALSSPLFDFRKLIRLCEEINTVYREGCYFATGMLMRGLLDHVPPLFGKNTFTEVANNYSGGGESFGKNMLHLDKAARKIADGHLHTRIRKSETLPVAQQVNFAPQLDVLLSEIVRKYQ